VVGSRHPDPQLFPQKKTPLGEKPQISLLYSDLSVSAPNRALVFPDVEGKF